MDKLQILFLRFSHKALLPALLCGASLFLFSFQPVSKGTSYEHQILPGPVSVHLLEIDPLLAKIELVHAQAFPLRLETTSSMALRNKAIAAVNGGFFRTTGDYAGTASGLLKIDGDWISSRLLTRGAIGWSKEGQEVLIDRLSIQSFFHVGRKKLSVMGLNQPRSDQDAILYKQPFFSTTRTSYDNGDKNVGTEVLVNDKGILNGCKATGNATIPYNGLVYSVGPEAKVKIPTKCYDQKASFSVTLKPLLNTKTSSEWQNCDNILGGTPVLVTQGAIIADFSAEKVRTSFLTQKHPRTAVGLKKDGHWIFVVVDGNQPNVSVGMTMQELASYMLSLDCEYALNLDGGGSSTLFLKDKIVNIPAGDNPNDLDVAPLAPVGQERAVSDAILIYDR